MNAKWQDKVAASVSEWGEALQLEPVGNLWRFQGTVRHRRIGFGPLAHACRHIPKNSAAHDFVNHDFFQVSHELD